MWLHKTQLLEDGHRMKQVKQQGEITRKLKRRVYRKSVNIRTAIDLFQGPLMQQKVISI